MRRREVVRLGVEVGIGLAARYDRGDEPTHRAAIAGLAGAVARGSADMRTRCPRRKDAIAVAGRIRRVAVDRARDQIADGAVARESGQTLERLADGVASGERGAGSGDAERCDTDKQKRTKAHVNSLFVVCVARLQ